ncbi:hypothetical protein [Brevibacterium gallinarum]|nr:hypothetical protein [Brevibacterium gallinarum]
MLGSLIAYLVALGIRRPEPIGADEPDPTLLEPDAPEATDATA